MSFKRAEAFVLHEAQILQNMLRTCHKSTILKIRYGRDALKNVPTLQEANLCKHTAYWAYLFRPKFGFFSNHAARF